MENQALESRDAICDYLLTCREVSAFCTQNGWIDNDTIRFDVVGRDRDSITVAIYFTEIVMEGSGCVADRIACFGRLKLLTDSEGRVEASIPV